MSDFTTAFFFLNMSWDELCELLVIQKCHFVANVQIGLHGNVNDKELLTFHKVSWIIRSTLKMYSSVPHNHWTDRHWQMQAFFRARENTSWCFSGKTVSTLGYGNYFIIWPDLQNNSYTAIALHCIFSTHLLIISAHNPAVVDRQSFVLSICSRISREASAM